MEAVLIHSELRGIVAGCDEAGRGCMAGPVFAAAVVLPECFSAKDINDSKKLTARKRIVMAEYIRNNAEAWAVAKVDNGEIDNINILQASLVAMHKALDRLSVMPERLLIDGNRFIPWKAIPYECVIGGDAKYLSIAAASILAKVARDDFMVEIDKLYPHYHWKKNKGYATADHIAAIHEYGYSPYHRRSFHLKGQLKLSF